MSDRRPPRRGPHGGYSNAVLPPGPEALGWHGLATRRPAPYELVRAAPPRPALSAVK